MCAPATRFPLSALASERAEWKTKLKGEAQPLVTRGAALFPRFSRGYYLIVPPGFRFAQADGL